MSYSWRERLRMRQKELIKKYNLKEEDLAWVEKYIEQLCSEADKRCKAIDPNKAVDQVIDDLDDEAFDKFTKGVIDEVKARHEKLRKLQKNMQKKKKKKSEIEEDEESDSQTDEVEVEQKEEEAIVA